MQLKAFAFQLEKGEQETPHFQVYIEFQNQTHFNSVKLKFPEAHIEAAKSGFDSWTYCTKEDTRVEGPFTYGVMPKPPTRSKQSTEEFNRACLSLGPDEMVKAGQLSLRDYIKVTQAVQIFNLRNKERTSLDKLSNEWHYGPTGTGKSFSVRQSCPGLFNKPFNKWWDGYQDQEVVLLDDMTPEHKWMLHLLLQWADHYPFTAETKGSTTQIRPGKIIVTSNFHPDQIFTGDEFAPSREAILRRFQVHHHSDPFEVNKK